MSSQPPPPPTVVRKGRGAFKQSLHSSAPQQESSQGELSGRGAEAGERFAFAFEKPMRPIDVTGAELGEAETARVQLFRKERRKRQIIIVGDVGKLASIGICKLFGHRGPKPLRLQDKWIRLVHIAMPFERHEEANQHVERQDVHENGAEGSVEAARTAADGGESMATEKAVEHTTEALEGESSTKPTAPVEGIAATDAPCEQYDKKPFISQSSQHAAFLSSSAPSEASSEPDRVRPLTVDVGGMVTAISSPVLTSLRFHTLTPFFLEQLHQLWKLEDIAKQRVQIHLNFGTGYVCANNNSRMVHDANFPELVDKWNDEALQLHFIKDCPPCVSRAVDATCGKDVVGSRHYSVAKLTFFSQDRQSRTIARALWNGDMNAFELVDVESVGVTFTWTVFSVDDKQHCHSAEEVSIAAQEQKDDGDNHGKKTVAFPVELGFRAFYRSKDVSAHATTGTAKAVLEKLTEAEHNIIRHGSASQYDAMDLSAVCEIDVNSHDQKLEHIQIEHVEQKKLRCGLLIESSNCLNIEGFENSVSQRTKSYRSAGHDNQDSWQLKQDGSDRGARDSGALSFFRTRTNMVHWKIDADRTIPENLALLDDAFYFAGRVLHKANAISTHDARGGAAPEAI